MSKCYIISGPKKNLIKGYWLYDFLEADGYEMKPFWMRLNDEEKYQKIKWILRLTKAIICILFKADTDDLIVVYDNDTSGVYLGLILSIFRPSLFVCKINCMANTSGALYSPLKAVFVRQGYKNIYTTVNNKEIAALFSSFLHLPETHFIPIPDSISDFGKAITEISNTSEKGYIFMGGNTHRDYNLFMDVAKELPQYEFVAIASSLYKKVLDNAPDNVSVYYSIPERDFYQFVANCSIVFIPLKNDLQGGQLVLFEGALLHKPLITTETIAIHTYFDDENIIVVPIGDKDLCVSKIQELMENKLMRTKMGNKAYDQIIKFTPEHIYRQYKNKLFIKR